MFPSTMEEDKKYPVIYVFHGIGSNEEDILDLVDELKDDFILIGVRGGYDREDGYAHYTIQGFGVPHRDVFDDCIERLCSFIDYAGGTYPIDVHRQYLLGFSQGAVLSMTLALRLGNSLKGIIALSGYLPNFVKEDYTIQPMDGVSIYISHGTYDGVYSVEHGRKSEEYFKKHCKDVRFSSFLTGHGITRENQMDFIQWIYENENLTHKK